MKKNRMMRLASVLLVAVLMTTCTISGTFAKYVTEINNSDTARVAAWGFGETSAINFNLFDMAYGNVYSSNDEDVIAPGTTKTETVILTYAGTAGKAAPEVAYKIDLEVVEASITDPIKHNPNIKWMFNTTGWVTWDELILAINDYEESVMPNDLPKIAKDGVTVAWKWAFDENDADAAGNYDVWDTAMGNANPLDSVKLGIKLTATQVD